MISLIAAVPLFFLSFTVGAVVMACRPVEFFTCRGCLRKLPIDEGTE